MNCLASYVVPQLLGDNNKLPTGVRLTNYRLWGRSAKYFKVIKIESFLVSPAFVMKGWYTLLQVTTLP